MHTRSDDPQALQEFAASIGTRDPKTVATYQTTMRDFVAWLAIQPGGTPFHPSLVTETAVRGYMDFLTTTNRAPRTRSKALSALRSGRWMKAIFVATRPVRWNVPRWWPSLPQNSQRSSALSSKRWWSGMLRPGLPPSLLWATGQGCVSARSLLCVWISVGIRHRCV
jgi:Phage integrase, N-terminal SAM-like domain